MNSVIQFPAQTGNALIPIRVSPMTSEHADAWHHQMQPIANRDPLRADRNWNWPTYRHRARLMGVAMERTRGHKYRSIALEFCPPSTREYQPFGLAILVVGYGAVGSNGHPSVFVWYLSDCPKGAFGSLSAAEIPKACASLLIDVAVVESFNSGYEGRVGLHAAPAGGDRLLQWYEKIGMINLAADAKLPGGARMKNDGRYFYYDPAGAAVAAARFDAYR